MRADGQKGVMGRLKWRSNSTCVIWCDVSLKNNYFLLLFQYSAKVKGHILLQRYGEELADNYLKNNRLEMAAKKARKRMDLMHSQGIWILSDMYFYVMFSYPTGLRTSFIKRLYMNYFNKINNESCFYKDCEGISCIG